MSRAKLYIVAALAVATYTLAACWLLKGAK